MEQTIKILEDVTKSFGFVGAVCVILILAISQIIKIPLKNKADEWSSATGIDKKVITCWFVFIPIIISLIVTFIFYSWRIINWNYEKFSWGGYISQAGVFSAISTTLYEAIDAFIKAKLAKEAKRLGVETSQTNLSKIRVAYSKMKKEEKNQKKALKAKAKEEAKAKKLAEVKFKEEKSKEEHIAALKKELSELESSSENKNVKLI